MLCLVPAAFVPNGSGIKESRAMNIHTHVLGAVSLLMALGLAVVLALAAGGMGVSAGGPLVADGPVAVSSFY